MMHPQPKPSPREIDTDRVNDSTDGVGENRSPIGEMRVINGWKRMKPTKRKGYQNDENVPYDTRTRSLACYTTLQSQVGGKVAKVHFPHRIFGIQTSTNLNQTVRAINSKVCCPISAK